MSTSETVGPKLTKVQNKNRKSKFEMHHHQVGKRKTDQKEKFDNEWVAICRKTESEYIGAGLRL